MNPIKRLVSWYFSGLRDGEKLYEEDLYRLSKDFDDLAIVRKMKEIVPEFETLNNRYKK